MAFLKINNLGSKMRRAGWLFLVALFVFTGLGVGVYAFWQATHPTTPASNSSQTSNDASSCTFSGGVSAAKLDAPAVYKPETKVTALLTSDLTLGTGAAAKSGDCVIMKYYGTLANNGKEFDEDFTQPTALQFMLGEGEVIPGWDQGIPGMKIGGVRRLTIPASLAYGDQAQGSIPANSALVFVVKLLAIR